MTNFKSNSAREKYQVQLHEKLKEIGQVFDIASVASVNPDKRYIQEYYRVNRLPYTFLHSSTGFIHMGISRGTPNHTKDLQEAAKTVARYIKPRDNVLELAMGRGANSIYLAQRFRDINITGIDLSPAQLAHSFKNTQCFQNIHPLQGDYHHLGAFASGQFDVVFVIEALCYSINKNKVISEVARVLKKGGHFIVIDGYYPEKRMTREERLARVLVERGMALRKLESYKSFRAKALKQGFLCVHEEDVSRNILPTLHKFEREARAFLMFPRLARVIAKWLPKEVTYNVVTGNLMATIIESGLGEYHISVFKKK